MVLGVYQYKTSSRRFKFATIVNYGSNVRRWRLDYRGDKDFSTFEDLEDFRDNTIDSRNTFKLELVYE